MSETDRTAPSCALENVRMKATIVRAIRTAKARMNKAEIVCSIAGSALALSGNSWSSARTAANPNQVVTIPLNAVTNRRPIVQPRRSKNLLATPITTRSTIKPSTIAAATIPSGTARSFQYVLIDIVLKENYLSVLYLNGTSSALVCFYSPNFSAFDKGSNPIIHQRKTY